MARLLVFFFVNEYNNRDKHEASGNQLVLFFLESRVGFVFPRVSFVFPRVLILIESLWVMIYKLFSRSPNIPRRSSRQ